VRRRPRGRSGVSPAFPMPGSILLVALLMFLSFLVLNPGLSLGESAPSSATGCHVKITSVSGITYKSLNRTITITGQCFGTDPVYVSLKQFGYTGKDTYDCGGPVNGPSLRILDSGRGDWAAGRFYGQDASCTATNAIGLNYFSWTNTKIVIHGFGNGLGLPGSDATWIMYPGDTCSVLVNHDHFGSRCTYTLPAGDC